MSTHSNTFFGMPHLNKNLLCSIDIITTGPYPSEDTILEIAVLPIDHMFRPHPKRIMFNVKMKPEEGKEVSARSTKMRESDLATAVLKGFDRYRAADMFLDWVKYQDLGIKKIMPLAWNWPRDSAFLRNWLTDGVFDETFDWRYRDVLSLATWVNDRVDCFGDLVPYAKVDLNYLANIHKIPIVDYRTSMNDVRVLMELYKAMLLHPMVHV